MPARLQFIAMLVVRGDMHVSTRHKHGQQVRQYRMILHGSFFSNTRTYTSRATGILWSACYIYLSRVSGCVSKVQQQHNSSSSIDLDRYQCRCIITPVNLLKMVSEPAALGWVVRLEMLCGADHITWGRTHAGNGNVMVTYFLRTTCRKFDGDNFLRTSYFIIPGIPGTLYLELRSRLRTCWYDTRTLLLAYTTSTYCVAAAQGTCCCVRKTIPLFVRTSVHVCLC